MIRIAEAKDIDALLMLCEQVQDLHLQNDSAHFKQFDKEKISNWFIDKLNDPKSNIWVFSDNAIIVGYVLVIDKTKLETEFTKTHNFSEIEHLVVDVNFRGRGIGGELLQQAIQFAKSQNMNVEVSAWAFNTSAQELYKKNRFAERSVRYHLL